MIVLIEGIDRVGKTTLKDYLVEKGFIDFEFKKLPLSQKDVENMKIKTILHMLKKLSHMNIVIDRLFLSEYVYGSVNRGYQNEEVFKFIDMAKELDIKIVFVYPTDIEESSRQHGSSLHHHQKVFEMLYDYTQQKGLNVYKCNYLNMLKTVEEEVL